jgi:hypothetical protein
MNSLPSHPVNALASLRSNGCSQRGAKFSVMLDVPLATQGFIAGFAAFGIEQNPLPPARRLGAYSCIVLPESPLYVSRLADIGSAITVASASQHTNKNKIVLGVFSDGMNITSCCSKN